MAICVGAAWAADRAAPAPAATVNGVVLEVKDVDSYTYLRLKTKDGEIWAAVAKAPVKTGAEVTIENVMVMDNFESKTLKKTFRPYRFRFHCGVGREVPPPAAVTWRRCTQELRNRWTPETSRSPRPPDRTRAPLRKSPRRTPTSRARPVAVRGKVVKFTPAVLGKNWIHLRDGTGSAADGTNDLVVTTKDEAKVGDVVLVKGVVQTDRDLGSGYSYKLLVEEATLQK